MSLKNISVVGMLSISSILLFSCGGSDSKESKSTNNSNPEVISHELSDAQMLNPVNYSDAGAGYIITNIFQTLLAIDFKTLELVPVVAQSRPEIETLPEGGMKITYQIRPEAKWDDGSPITAKDIEFALKVIKCPKVDNANNKPYYEFITDMIFYDDPKKFSFITNDVYILSEVMSGDMPLMPKSVYDPKGLLDEFTVKNISERFDELSSNPKILEFAENFNSEKYQREKDFIKGSGAYLLDEWQTGQKIVLKRKEKWWGDELKGTNCYFDAYPPKIIYQTINDQTTAIVALKAGNIDVMRGIKAKDFKELPKSKKFTDNFNAHTPQQMAYTYLGLNVRKPIFSNKKTRQALAHLVDVDKIIEVIAYGYGEKAIGPIHPAKKKQYNHNIKPYKYDPEKAKQLLAEAGWADTDGDGILDNTINGEKIKFEFTYLYNSGNDARKATGLLLQEECRKVGIKMDVIAQDWSIFLESTKNHDFDMYYGAWISTPIPNDHKQIFHTSSYNGGSNYTGFGNDYTDALIDSIRVEIDEDKRAKLNHKFQEILHDECSYIFLYYPLERIAIHKRFDVETSPMRPGYWLGGFKVQQPAAK